MPENTTAVGTVMAVDPDAGDTVVHTLSGADAALFTLDPASGALAFAAAPDFERPADTASTSPASPAGDNVYLLAVTATSGIGDRALTATRQVRVTVTDVDGEAPGAPGAPTFAAGATSLEVAWAEPAVNPGPPVDDYDLRYRRRGTTQWTPHPHAGAARTATLAGLDPETAYEVQVKAKEPRGRERVVDDGHGEHRGQHRARVHVRRRPDGVCLHAGGERPRKLHPRRARHGGGGRPGRRPADLRPRVGRRRERPRRHRALRPRRRHRWRSPTPAPARTTRASPTRAPPSR